MVDKKPHFEEEYRGYHIACTEAYGTWNGYIQRRLIPNVGFADREKANKWLKSQVDKLILAKNL